MTDKSIVLGEELTIRSLNPDNRKDVIRLIKLFREQYGDSHPLRRVFEPEFWTTSNRRSHRKSELVSIVASHEKRIYAHLAYQIDYQSGAAQLLLPAIAPDFREGIFSVVRLFWARITEVARRQGWRAVITYAASNQPLQQLLAAKCFGAEACALFSCGQEALAAAPANTLLPMLRPLNPALVSTMPVVIPEPQQALAWKLYQALGLKRELRNAADGPFYDPSSPLSRPCSVYTLRAYNIQLIRLRGSQLGNESECWRKISNLDKLAEKKKQPAVFQLSSQDPLSDSLGTRLADLGYSFSGIVPLMLPEDVLVYAKVNPAELARATLYTKISREIRERIFKS